MRIVCKAAACAGRPCCRAVYCTLPNSHANERPLPFEVGEKEAEHMRNEPRKACSTLSAHVRPSAHAGAAVVAPAWRHEPPLRRRNCNPLPGRRSSPVRDRPSACRRPSSQGRPRANPCQQEMHLPATSSLRGLGNLCANAHEEAVCPDGRPRGRCGEDRLGGRHYRPRHACGTEAGPVWVACRQHIHRRRVQALDPLVHRAVHADHGRQREPGHAVAFRH